MDKLKTILFNILVWVYSNPEPVLQIIVIIQNI